MRCTNKSKDYILYLDYVFFLIYWKLISFM